MLHGRGAPFGGTGTLACADVAALRTPHSQEWLCHMTAARALRSRRIDRWFAKSPHPPLVFFLEVLILSGFKSIKTELLILRGLRARFAEVFIMRSLVSGTLRPAIRSTGRSACATKLRARGVRFVRKRSFCWAPERGVFKFLAKASKDVRARAGNRS